MKSDKEAVDVFRQIRWCNEDQKWQMAVAERLEQIYIDVQRIRAHTSFLAHQAGIRLENNEEQGQQQDG